MKFCDILESGNPIISAYIQHHKDLYPSLPFECPIKPGRYFQYNVTVSDSDVPDGKDGNQFFRTIATLPNGLYKQTLTFKTLDDPQCLMVQFIGEIKVRLNDDQF